MEDPWKLEKEHQYFYSIIISALLNFCFLVILVIRIAAAVQLLSCVRLFATPWTAAYQAPPSMGFSRQEYWSRVPSPSPEDLPNLGMEPRSPIL